MQTSNIYVFLQQNMTGCRMFWGCMYTMLFIFAWVSFYSSEIWINNMSVFGKDNSSLAMSVYVAMGFVVYWALFLVIPVAYLIHFVIKEKIGMDRVKSVFGTSMTRPIFKFLVAITFPFFSISLIDVFQDVASMWMCIFLGASLLCLVMCYGNPDDYGIAYAFLGIWVGILAHVKQPLEKNVVLTIIAVSMYISRDESVFQRHTAKEAEVIKTNSSQG